MPRLKKKYTGRDDWPYVVSISVILDCNQLVRSRRTKRRLLPIVVTSCCLHSLMICGALIIREGGVAGNGEKCEPFTVTDDASRFLVRCTLRAGKGITHVKLILTAAFIDMVCIKRSAQTTVRPLRHGPPLGLSERSVWLMRLRLVHERIGPGKPQQNVRHERMHLSMLADKRGTVTAIMREEQKRLNHWQDEFNYERPHEALNFNIQASCFIPSPRPMPRHLPKMSTGRGSRCAR